MEQLDTKLNSSQQQMALEWEREGLVRENGQNELTLLTKWPRESILTFTLIVQIIDGDAATFLT